MKPIFVRGISNQFRLTLAIILSVALLVANHRLDPVRQNLSSVFSPLQYLASVPGAALDWSSESFATRNMLALQNKELLRQQLLMSERLQRFEHLRQENERLRALLGSPAYLDSRKMVAEVLEVASDPFHHYVVLNHGSRSGVFVGQPVVDAQGVVGQVVQVSEMTSRVLLLSDVSHGLPVRITRNDVRLVANGTGELDEIELRHVAKSTDIRVGDLLVTSGLGNRFPEGYPVARVMEVLTEDGQSYARVTAQPLAALDRIRYVLLIWPSPDSGVTLPNQPTVPAADHSLIENSSKIGSASPAEGTSADTTKPVTTPAATVAKPATETTPPATEVHQ
ncbi:rod shape-determining protein MreC [Shewanella baltica]|jgi:rod shape-determining protein MreC|uniref:Cell shape-determining protein MreC n=2 Tax=Shewanella TaxID=22 RepID=A9KZD8_SHEB9|nr:MULTISPECIES: rod shape-determining protein MreC [Shewanella]ABS06666.1 rod shape-determining protein MreC [Shewanella baltica OS185]ABX47697.1 rod shape-determining protein MreC [Shewanella baltica OS195]ADT92723.1 rod shape-determining protein MreC [Shewanella baltica OS678]EHC04509.1 rod shape-determining protein MreC [Shewanella baltica OS625]KZK69595.1 rod shape-determining protein MreC [Shewanella baltica]